MSTITVVDQSDVELLVRVRAGDTLAEQVLLERHRAAVAELGESPCFASVEASGRLALALVRQGADRELPFRATWLAVHAQGNVPAAPARDAVVWSAYQSLPAAWRLAVWHREVEGQRPREIARYLGMSEEQTVRALASAYAALKRRVAIAHTSTGAAPVCEEIVNTYRFSPPSSLPTAEVRALREHGRHCDDCLGLIRNLFLIEHTLRAALGHVVMGRAADAYLARRPAVARLRVPAAEQVHRERRVNPVLASLSAAAVGAAAMSLVLSTPAISPVQDGSRVVAADAPAPGSTLWPADATGSRAGGPGAGSPGFATPTAVGAASGGQGSRANGGEGPGPGAGDPGAPTPPATPPATPPSTPEPPTDPPADPTAGLSLDVDLAQDAATVSVAADPGPEQPVVVEVPVPVPVPDLPDDGLGGLLP